MSGHRDSDLREREREQVLMSQFNEHMTLSLILNKAWFLNLLDAMSFITYTFCSAWRKDRVDAQLKKRWPWVGYWPRADISKSFSRSPMQVWVMFYCNTELPLQSPNFLSEILAKHVGFVYKLKDGNQWSFLKSSLDWQGHKPDTSGFVLQWGDADILKAQLINF